MKKKKKQQPEPELVTLIIDGELNEEALHTSVAIIAVLSGAYPLLNKDDSLQATYEAISNGATTDDLMELGEQ